MTIPLQSKLSNGATVSDWLGTAKTAAFVAAHLIEDIREGRKTQDGTFLSILESLEHARLEIVAVQSHVANENLRNARTGS